MKRIKTKKVGSIYTWHDFTKSRRDPSSNLITHSQSNTKLNNFNQRYIGLHLSHDNNIYVAVAVNRKKEQGNWWKFIIESRIHNVIRNGNNIGPDDRGVTMVPMAYKDALYKDPFTYTNLYGIIDPTYLDMALSEAVKNNAKLIDIYSATRPEINFG